MTLPTTDDLPAAAPSTEGAHDETIRHELPCACGYDLRGLAQSGRCPECGENVSTAIRWNANPLGPPAVIRRMVRGLTVVLIAYVAWVVVLFLRGLSEGGDQFAYWLTAVSGPKTFIIGPSFFSVRGMMAVSVVIPLLYVVHVVGTWLFTTPHGYGRASTLRKLGLMLRWSSIGVALLSGGATSLWMNRYPATLGWASVADTALCVLWGTYLTALAWKLGKPGWLRAGGWSVTIGSALFGCAFAAAFLVMRPARAYWEVMIWTTLGGWAAMGLLCTLLLVLMWGRLRRELAAAGAAEA
jgi:hypothetical protein